MSSFLFPQSTLGLQWRHFKCIVQPHALILNPKILSEKLRSGFRGLRSIRKEESGHGALSYRVEVSLVKLVHSSLQLAALALPLLKVAD